MKGRTRALIIALPMVVVGVLVCYGPFVTAQRNCRAFRDFCDYVKAHEWSAAQGMLLTAPGRLRIEEGAILYGGRDATEIFLTTPPSFRRTFRYHLRNRDSAMVLFERDAAILWGEVKDQKISFAKIP